MIFSGAIMVLLALLGAPLFILIAGGAMLGYLRSDIDLSAIAIA